MCCGRVSIESTPTWYMFTNQNIFDERSERSERLFYILHKKHAPQGNNNLAKRVELCYTDNAAIGGKALHNNGRRLATLPERG